jgi:hypothetical protein
MTPTANLRFVERNEKVTLNGEEFDNWRKVLQQWWEDRNIRLTVLQYDKYGMPIMRHPGEWRDVPLYKDAP